MKPLYRPKLNLPNTKTEKYFDIIGFGVFIISNLFIFFQWNELPDRIPAHFNAVGEVDRWGSKMEILILPVIGILLLFLMSIFEKAPHMHNYPSRMNETNVRQFYLNSRKILNATKNTGLLLFSYINIECVQIALGKKDSISSWFLPVFLILIFLPIVIGLYKQSKIK